MSTTARVRPLASLERRVLELSGRYESSSASSRSNARFTFICSRNSASRSCAGRSSSRRRGDRAQPPGGRRVIAANTRRRSGDRERGDGCSAVGRHTLGSYRRRRPRARARRAAQHTAHTHPVAHVLFAPRCPAFPEPDVAVVGVGRSEVLGAVLRLRDVGSLVVLLLAVAERFERNLAPQRAATRQSQHARELSDAPCSPRTHIANFFVERRRSAIAHHGCAVLPIIVDHV